MTINFRESEAAWVWAPCCPQLLSPGVLGTWEEQRHGEMPSGGNERQVLPVDRLWPSCVHCTLHGQLEMYRFEKFPQNWIWRSSCNLKRNPQPNTHPASWHPLARPYSDTHTLPPGVPMLPEFLFEKRQGGVRRYTIYNIITYFTSSQSFLKLYSGFFF